MPLSNCEVNLFLTWSDKCVLSNAGAQAITFAITDTKLYVPVVTSSTQENAKLLQQLKSGFKRTINWNKYQSKVLIQATKTYLDYLIDPSFQGVNRPFVLSFENNTDRPLLTKYHLPTVETKGYNVMIDGKNFFDKLVKNNLKTFDYIRKIVTVPGDDYTVGCLLHYNHFNKYDKMMAIDLSKQQALDADPKAIQQINFTGNLVREGDANTTMFCIIEEAKETISNFQ